MPLLLREGVFVRSGFIELPYASGTLRNPSLTGYGWSTRSDAATTAYVLGFSAEVAHSSAGPTSRWVGFPLRCLSTVLDM